eukprot:SAG31_NODE_4789_length_2955_cov_1.493347_5_plen_79_part_00
MRYYDSGPEKDGVRLGNQKGELDLRGCEAVRVSTAPNAHDLEIEVVTRARTYRLIAATVEDQQDWITWLSVAAGLLEH